MNAPVGKSQHDEVTLADGIAERRRSEAYATMRMLHRRVAELQQQMDDAAGEFHRAVAKALDNGASATDLAERLDVTRARVYQWRDKARK